jgi:hypothetical protein
MAATNYEIFAASLAIMQPEMGVALFAEGRISTSLFPKDEAERACFEYIVAHMLASPNWQQSTKAELERDCRSQFNVTVGSFDECWREAIKASGACWNQQGRRSRKNFSR